MSSTISIVFIYLMCILNIINAFICVIYYIQYLKRLSSEFHLSSFSISEVITEEDEHCTEISIISITFAVSAAHQISAWLQLYF